MPFAYQTEKEEILEKEINSIKNSEMWRNILDKDNLISSNKRGVLYRVEIK